MFFDNLQVTHTQSPILEETHYYPFGLAIAAISSKRLEVVNPYKFNAGTELNTSLDLNFYETTFRTQDPQLGRFWQIDPLAELTIQGSPYTYANNNPILFNDPLGLISEPKSGDIEKGEDGVWRYDAVTVMGKGKSKSRYSYYTSFGETDGYGSIEFADIDNSISNSGGGAPSRQVGSVSSPATNNQYSWMPIDKAFLRDFYKQNYYGKDKKNEPSDADLGIQFESVFYLYYAVNNGISYNRTKYTDGGERNTVPDFTNSADLMQTTKGGISYKVGEVEEAIWWELKTSKSIYLSSNTYQIKGHIDNIAAKFAERVDLKKEYNFKPTVRLVTMNEIASPGLLYHAIFKNVNFEHWKGYYKRNTNGPGYVYTFKIDDNTVPFKN